MLADLARCAGRRAAGATERRRRHPPEAHPELAECVVLRTDARSKLSELEERERERTGIKSLKVKYASAFGYAIEIGKSLCRQRSGRLRAQADADDRRTLYHAGTQRTRTGDFDGASASRAPRTATLRRAARSHSGPHRRSASSGGRARRNRRSAPRSPSARPSAATCAPPSLRKASFRSKKAAIP